MLTIPLRIPSTSASEASLKETSHTLMIFCKSSSKPISLLSSEISAERRGARLVWRGEERDWFGG